MEHLKHPATIIATLALFAALGGGAAWASGLISGSRIRNHSIPAKKLTKSALKSLHGKRGVRGPAGPPGPTGPAGATGPRGPVGPSSSVENRERAIAGIGVDESHPVALTTLTVSGPASYLVTASGSVYPAGAQPGNCDGTFQLDADGFAGPYSGVSSNEAGASVDASGNYVVGTYSVIQLVTVPSGSHTLTIDAWDHSGTDPCATFENALVATQVGSATTTAAHFGNKTGVSVGTPR